MNVNKLDQDHSEKDSREQLDNILLDILKQNIKYEFQCQDFDEAMLTLTTKQENDND